MSDLHSSLADRLEQLLRAEQFPPPTAFTAGAQCPR